MVKNRWAFALIGLCLVWRLTRLLLDFPVWGDEAMVAINFFDSGYGDLFSPLEYGQIGPLGWLWLEKLMFDIGDGSLLVMRVPSFLAGAASVFLFWSIAQRIVEQRAALFALAIFCASYYPMRYSIELKPYAFDLLIALLIIECALSKSPRRLFLIAGIGVFFSLPSMFMAAACGLYLFQQLASERKWLLVAGALLIAEYAWMTHSFTSVHADAAPWLREMDMWVTAFPPLSEWWTIPLWLIDRHAGYMSAYPTGGSDYGSTATLLLQIIGAVVLWRKSQKQYLWILWGSLPFLFIASSLQAYPYGGSVRVAIFLAPAICICSGLGLSKLMRHQKSLPIFASLMMLMMVGGIYKDVAEPYKSKSDLVVEQVVSHVVSTVGNDVVLLGHLPDRVPGESVELRTYGGGLARLRYLLRRDFGRDADWTSDSSLEALSAEVAVIYYKGHDEAPTLR